MILGILKFVHVAFGLTALGAGGVALFGIFSGELLGKWTKIFLECALTASVTGLLFPFHHLLPTHWAAMLSVYVCAVVVLAWHKYRLAGIWAPVFAISVMVVLCIDFLVVIDHVFMMFDPTQFRLMCIVTGSTITLLFSGIGLFTVNRYRNRPINSANDHGNGSGLSTR
jgi:hypothetical protein